MSQNNGFSFSFVNQTPGSLGETNGRPSRIVACNECKRRRAKVRQTSDFRVPVLNIFASVSVQGVAEALLAHGAQLRD